MSSTQEPCFQHQILAEITCMWSWDCVAHWTCWLLPFCLASQGCCFGRPRRWLPPGSGGKAWEVGLGLSTHGRCRAARATLSSTAVGCACQWRGKRWWVHCSIFPRAKTWGLQRQLAFVSFSVQGVEPRPSHMLGRCSATELRPAQLSVFVASWVGGLCLCLQCEWAVPAPGSPWHLAHLRTSVEGARSTSDPLFSVCPTEGGRFWLASKHHAGLAVSAAAAEWMSSLGPQRDP